MSIRTYFENIANAIKEKNPDVVTVTPSEMPDAILNIPSGGGSGLIEPLHYDMKLGYVAGDMFYYAPNENTYCDVYELETLHRYILTPGVTYGVTYGNRFRVMSAMVDPYVFLQNISGTMIVATDSPQPTMVVKFQNSDNKYLIISKTNIGQTGLKTYLIDCTEWV